MFTMLQKVDLLLFLGDHNHTGHPDYGLAFSVVLSQGIHRVPVFVPTVATNLNKNLKISKYKDNSLKKG